MNRAQEMLIVGYYSTIDNYIRIDNNSSNDRSVFMKENDKYMLLVLEQKGQREIEVRQTDRHGTVMARDSYELTRNVPKCLDVERLCKDSGIWISFSADEINLIYQFGEQDKMETCASLSAILPKVQDRDTKQIIGTALKKLTALSEEVCVELISTTQKRKLTERDHSIRTRLAEAKEQSKQSTAAKRKTHIPHNIEKADLNVQR